jgi:hypothetical protein
MDDGFFPRVFYTWEVPSASRSLILDFTPALGVMRNADNNIAVERAALFSMLFPISTAVEILGCGELCILPGVGGCVIAAAVRETDPETGYASIQKTSFAINVKTRSILIFWLANDTTYSRGRCGGS